MTSSRPRDISNAVFVRFYRRNRRSAVKRGENEHRRRILDGLTGRVVELGPGDGANFPLYPTTVIEREHGGKVVKQIGDALMLAFRDALDAARFARTAR